MQPAGIVTLILVGLAVVALAAYLIYVALILRHVSFTLGTIIAGLRSIALQTEPLRRVIDEINGDLSDVDAALTQVLEKKRPSGSSNSSKGKKGRKKASKR